MKVDTTTGSAEHLREAMVEAIDRHFTDKGQVLAAEIRQALLAVPRHMYCPGTSLEEAYRHDHAVITDRRDGEDISSVSAAYLIAEMLDQAVSATGGLQGRHVLEIGSGGYNASLLAELVGESGSVTTVDIDPKVTARAQECLAAAGYDRQVAVVCADAEYPIGRRSFDMIIVTAGAWDIPPAWREQLIEGGVLVVPLRTWGLTRSWALRRDGDRLVSHAGRQCGFVPVRGASEHRMRYEEIADGVYLRLDEGQRIDSARAAALLAEDAETVWAGVSLPPRTALPDLDLWLATRLSAERGQFVVLSAQQSAVDAGTVRPSWRFGAPALLTDEALVYRSRLRWTDRRFDLGATAHGHAAAAAAGRMVEHMRAWLEAGSPSPGLHVAPAGTPDGDLPKGTVLAKRHCRLVLTEGAPR